MNREYKSLQFKTTPNFGAWTKISDQDLERLERMQQDGWEVYQVVNIRGSLGFTSHVLFMLHRNRDQ